MFTALFLSLQLSIFTTLLLLLFAIPIAYALSRFHSFWRAPIEALMMLPMVLPPTVLGFYLLIAFGDQGFLGKAWIAMTGHALAFTFSGLIVGSCISSLPFAIQPMILAFCAMGRWSRDVAFTLGMTPARYFFTILLPLAKQGILTASIFTFFHTLGEFGMVLMIGGNIPGKTQVISTAIYDAVERMNNHQANLLSFSLLIFSFGMLFLLFLINQRHSDPLL